MSTTPKLARSKRTRVTSSQKQQPQVRRTAAANGIAGPPSAEVLPGTTNQAKLALAAACLWAGVWAYWPSLLQLVRVWDRETDYSHGFLVIPLAVLFMWLRRASYPGLAASSPVLGIGLLALSLTMRFVGAKYFFTFMDGWSIVPW